MKVETKWLIDYYQKILDNAGSSYEIDFARNAIHSLRNGACPVCHADLPEKVEKKRVSLLGKGVKVVVKKGKHTIVKAHQKG